MVRRVIRRGMIVLAVVSMTASGTLAVVPPRDGAPLPDSYFTLKGKDPSALTLKHAWIQKSHRVRAAREALLATEGPSALALAAPGRVAIGGTMHVPVLPGYFLGGSAPVTQAALQNKFFDNNPTGTIGQYYSEVSYGQFTVDGDVSPWIGVSHNNAYYAGSSNGTIPGEANTGEFIKEILDVRDATIDFRQYDNDGPDGIPNSGDDDGIVDVLVVLHNLPGYECGTYPANILSHEWLYSAWPVSGGVPYQTNDAAAGGGLIKIDDYIIASAVNCSNTGANDVGVLCHELGHALGLPDLYDRDGGGNGIGDWGIMGTGAWNTPDRPAHEDPWSRKELGWLVPTPIDWQPTAVSVPSIEGSPVAYRLPFTDERFRRSLACALAGSYSLYCGLTEAEATTRGWVSPETGGGYGSNWDQTIERSFHYSGSGAVAFQFDYRYDCELDFDFAYALVDVDGVEATLATYTGSGSGTATIDLTPYLAPLSGAGGDYTLRFRFTSDLSLDDADGGVPSDCGAFAVDDVSVTGGGESYATDFEVYADGWHQVPAENPVSEYWLVENRARTGFDEHLHGEGLLIWHVDEEVLRAAYGVNDGLAGVRGLVVEEADGQFNLNNGPNLDMGSGGDVFPGTTNNTTFDNLSAPASTDNTGRSTRISVTNIGPAGPTISATLRAGDRGPLATGAAPNLIDNDQVAVLVDVGGDRIRHGATFRLVKSGTVVESPAGAADPGDMVATSLEWIDATLLRGTVNAYGKTGGPWDLVVTNPDGQEYTLASAVTVNQIVATHLVSASIRVIGDGVQLRYELFGQEPGETLHLYRSAREDGGWVEIVENLQPDRGATYVYLDKTVEAGRTYFYLLESRLPGGDIRELHRGSASVPARDVVLEQNHPNPFNPRTTIRFYVPSRAPVRVEVFDVRGALVRRLAEGTFDAGPHTVDWDGRDADGRPVASGVYAYRLTVDRRSLTRKMMLLK